MLPFKHGTDEHSSSSVKHVPTGVSMQPARSPRARVRVDALRARGAVQASGYTRTRWCPSRSCRPEKLAEHTNSAFGPIDHIHIRAHVRTCRHGDEPRSFGFTTQLYPDAHA